MKIVVVTGANRGIGLALVRRFLDEGFFVVGTSRNGKIATITHTNFTVLKLDVTSTQSINDFIKEIDNKAIKIDLLVNNAGIGLDLDEETPQIDIIKSTFETNVFGLINFTESIKELMEENGTILNISSVMGMLNREKIVPNATAYRMSKAALNMYTKTLAARLMDTNIRVLSIHPGWVKTDMGGQEADITPEFSANGIFELYKKQLPTGTFWAAENLVQLNW